jgi:hypothetical protein
MSHELPVFSCVEIAEQNPHKFRLDYGELESRKQFIRDTRAVIKVCLCVCEKEGERVEGEGEGDNTC